MYLCVILPFLHKPVFLSVHSNEIGKHIVLNHITEPVDLNQYQPSDYAKPVTRHLCEEAGYTFPEICTPLELLAEDSDYV